MTRSDPRVFFASERTLLAWLRTGIQAFGQADLPVHAAQQQRTKVGWQRAAVEIASDRQTGHGGKRSGS